MRIRILCLLASALLASSCATLVVEHVTDPTAPDGVFYALPRTVVRVNLKVDRMAKEGAEFVRYAAIFAPGNKVVCETPDCSGAKDKKVEYTIQDGAIISSIGTPDPAHVYLVKFSGGGTIDQSIGMTWNEQGLLSSAGASVTNRTADVVMSGIKLAATLGTKGAFGAGTMAIDKEKKKEKCRKDGLDKDIEFIALLREHAKPPADADLVENYCAIEKKDREALILEEDLLIRATTTYKTKIFSLIQGRRRILEGSSQVSEAASVLPAIEAELGKRLAALYVGTKSIKTWEGTLDVSGIEKPTPAEQQNFEAMEQALKQEVPRQTLELLKIDTGKGVCIGAGAVEPPDAKPFPDGFHDSQNPVVCTSTNMTVNVNWTYYPRRVDQLVEKVLEKNEGKLSFRYRIPAQAKLWIEAASDGKASRKGAAVLSIAQLGKVIALPAERHSKTLSYDLAFIESTGALKSFKLGTTGGFDAATLDSLTDTSGMVLDAEAARKKERKAALDARKTAEDELTILTREQALLELRDSICTLKQKYGLACDDPPK